MSLPFSGLAWKLSVVLADAAGHRLRALARLSLVALVSLFVQAGY